MSQNYGNSVLLQHAAQIKAIEADRAAVKGIFNVIHRNKQFGDQIPKLKEAVLIAQRASLNSLEQAHSFRKRAQALSEELAILNKEVDEFIQQRIKLVAIAEEARVVGKPDSLSLRHKALIEQARKEEIHANERVKMMDQQLIEAKRSADIAAAEIVEMELRAAKAEREAISFAAKA